MTATWRQDALKIGGGREGHHVLRRWHVPYVPNEKPARYSRAGFSSSWMFLRYLLMRTKLGQGLKPWEFLTSTRYMCRVSRPVPMSV